MEKCEMLDKVDEDIICDEKKKEEVKKELDYCHALLKREYEKLYDYQLNYFCWVNSRKDIVASMKVMSISSTQLDETINFCNVRNSFLIEKLKMMFSSITYIESVISKFDNINDFVELDSIDTELRVLLTSLGLSVPSNIFGEPF